MTSILDFISALQYPVVWRPFITSIIIGIVCAIVGVFMVLRKLIFFGNGIAHSAFAGGALGYLLGWNPIFPIAGFAILTAFGIGYINKRNKISNEIAIGIFFSFSMALGVLFISLYNTYSTDIGSMLFGSLSSISVSEFTIIMILGIIILFLIFAVKKELYFITFDEELAKANGMPVNFLSFYFLFTVALTIVMCISTVGIILVMAFIVVPAASAYQFTYKINRMLIYSTFFAIFGSIIGFAIAFIFDISGGATIVIILTIIFSISMIISPKRRSKLPQIGEMCPQCVKVVHETHCSYCEMDGEINNDLQKKEV
ncbi:metal ABC transporter permease [Promethearchaeum syntrophicum]|uniref:Metal ABC transporter permease n=1 Tax=Promethearchaeum syntrophicum TaxID=2594042 RepID=A0A5B9D7Q1_9ARCH|nr:metal ABC transporter permease [Candidatus Prometheoarchaeum syntrophicum]QEE15051.1 high-affinity zinc transporter membrane component [Candidatus Prometheoarchaeum syntrophicum]